MSSSAIWFFGFISLSISAFATMKAARRRRAYKEKISTINQGPRPLILPWLVSENNSLDSVVFNRNDVFGSPFIVTVKAGEIQNDPPLPQYYNQANPPTSYFYSNSRDSLPPYFDYHLPALAEPSYQKKATLESEFRKLKPLSEIPSLPGAKKRNSRLSSNFDCYNDKQEEPELQYYDSRIIESFHVPLKMAEVTPKKIDLEENDSSFSSSRSSWRTAERKDSVASCSYRDSMSSISTSVSSFSKDSLDFNGDQEESFANLGIVLGTGSRLQAQYGILTKPSKEQKSFTLTPVKHEQNNSHA
ncbi:hypothetical protein BY996DRAFT_6428782 [Phakopsora pachyrhizi]|uniref:Expressed protein n=1 Tax=Phakopsora pachyrhizi TaxID=170000 RepID=A0AAV0AMM6_PHAPC|nr:hypothetical protein BY996DRAFT_6428782 [Phakopsora pachyrhizi]CAH7670157.1 expressed protein [Phakopsora pachyrhizi]